MAIECLVRKYDGSGGRKSGDIISVKPVPNSGWGAGEGPPNYIRVLVNGIDIEDFRPYNVRHCPTGHFIDGQEVTVRSKFRFNFAILPNYNEQGVEISVNRNQCVQCLINRVDEYLASL